MPATGEADLVLVKDAASGTEAPLLAGQTTGPKLADIKKLEPEESPSMKRKDVESSTSHRFKVVSQLVIAMKRFQGSLNPTYTYGKRPASSSSSGSGAVAGSFKKGATSPEPVQEATSGSFARQFSRPGEPGAPKVPRKHDVHGNRTNILFRPLPPLPSENPEASLQHVPSGKSVA
ncbi:g8957 [Coccomyxa elongata]